VVGDWFCELNELDRTSFDDTLRKSHSTLVINPIKIIEVLKKCSSRSEIYTYVSIQGTAQISLYTSQPTFEVVKTESTDAQSNI
jgi:hypothetical protein